jgi:hypothetical protein
MPLTAIAGTVTAAVTPAEAIRATAETMITNRLTAGRIVVRQVTAILPRVITGRELLKPVR